MNPHVQYSSLGHFAPACDRIAGSCPRMTPMSPHHRGVEKASLLALEIYGLLGKG